jgi:hypothetical protein
VDIHEGKISPVNKIILFIAACANGQIEIAKWLIQDYQVDIHAKDEDAFRWSYRNRSIKIINWFVEEYRYSKSPYYYCNQTAYILNH